ncbi:MAG: DUF1553 domain-containing protein [Planctomycetes bacterium]|nr:DUF1553 domain-containing protein [Planctomycetota bacterium]
MTRIRIGIWAIGAAVLLGAPSAVTAQENDEARLEFFERRIRPLLASNCYNCHSANTNSHGGLRVDDRNGLIQGGGRGPAIVPGHPETSLLLQAVRQTHKKVKMPPNKKLGERDIADLTRWIKDGAAWPKPIVPASVGRSSAEYDRLRKEHWAWQPMRRPQLPKVQDTSWPLSDVDRFVLANLEEKGLKPVGGADPVTLIRRLTFDITGLPPTPAEVVEFVARWKRARPQVAIAQLVDRLLSSPGYGERWGRHWLDVARYGESTGSARNLPYPHAWRYRDYVIDAFNRDKPYDRFICEQIAGDLLPADSPRQRDEQLIATGFLALGVRDVNQRFKVRFVMDNIDEQIDTVTRSVLALTASCARCHNHKFDPIPTTDYYALAGIFGSSDLCAGLRNKMGGGGMDYYDPDKLHVLGSGEKNDPATGAKIADARAALARGRAEFNSLRDDPKFAAGPEREKKLVALRQRVNKLQNDLLALEDPATHWPVAYGVRDSKIIADAAVRIRGEAEMLGPSVPRGFLSLLPVSNVKISGKNSGRLELAQWLTSPQNPLTPRVIVNRVWKHLFGQGIVASVDNFGVTGELPSHPELLDHLATQLVRDGWSLKKLIRSLVLSRAYQLGFDAPDVNVAADPGNRLIWRHSPRRLDAEELRDAMLAAAGALDRARPKGSLAGHFKVTEMTNNGAQAKKLEEQAHASEHRSVYLPLVRGLTPRPLEVFDFADQGLVTGSRDSTTVAPQALYLLNDPFVSRQAHALAERVQRAKDDDEQRAARIYRFALARTPTPKETERALAYIAEYESALRDETPTPRAAAWASFCHAILASAEFRFVR